MSVAWRSIWTSNASTVTYRLHGRRLGEHLIDGVCVAARAADRSHQVRLRNHAVAVDVHHRERSAQRRLVELTCQIGPSLLNRGAVAYWGWERASQPPGGGLARGHERSGMRSSATTTTPPRCCALRAHYYNAPTLLLPHGTPHVASRALRQGTRYTRRRPCWSRPCGGLGVRFRPPV